MMRDLAALLLDRHLRRLARMRNPVEWRLARLLHRLDEASGYLDLGFARLQDYAAERLGLRARRVLTLVRLARRLRDLPLAVAAYEAGRVSESQVRVLLRVVSPATEAAWLERARTLNVRLLEREVRAALLAQGEPPTDEPIAAAPSDSPSDSPSLDDDDAEDDGEMIGITVPARLRARWEQVLELARRSAGAPDPVWRCAEFIAADYLAGVPDLAALLARSLNDQPDDRADQRGESVQTFAGEVEAGGAQAPADSNTDLFEEILHSLEEETGTRRWLPPVEALEVVLPAAITDEPSDTPRRLDDRLLECARLRQNLAWHQGRLLRVFAGQRLYRELGFLSFSRYCRERAGLGVRRAWHLISLERRLWELPAIARAYRTGSLSWVKAAAIARVADESTETSWFHLARSVTVRRLLDEVAVVQADVERWWDERSAPALSSSGRRILGGRLPARRIPPGLDAAGRVQLLAPTLTGRGRERINADADRSGAQSECWTCVRFWAPHEVAALWHQALHVCRALTESDVSESESGRSLADWECLDRLLDSFFSTWAMRGGPAWQRRYRVFERDGWRCRVPGCSSRRNLQVHHVVFRSQGGSDDDGNLAVLCATHHLQGIHRGRLRCHALPDGLLAWDLGVDPGGLDSARGPLVRYVEDVAWEEAFRG